MIQTGKETDAASSESYSSAEANVEKYLMEPNQPREFSSITYWKEKNLMYPILGKLSSKLTLNSCLVLQRILHLTKEIV